MQTILGRGAPAGKSMFRYANAFIELLTPLDGLEMIKTDQAYACR